MAIMWNLIITPIDIPGKEASVVATRIDDDVAHPSTRVYTLSSVTLSNQAQQLATLDRIWKMHEGALALEGAVANFLVDLAGQGKANLEARE